MRLTLPTRPLAYSMLADLIHHVRESLDRGQIGRTVEVYTKNLHDNFPGTSFQTMSAKLLLNLAEYIAKLNDKQEGKKGAGCFRSAFVFRNFANNTLVV